VLVFRDIRQDLKANQITGPFRGGHSDLQFI